jgi:hypothetical protein
MGINIIIIEKALINILENISTIIEKIIDDYTINCVVKKIKYEKIFKNYTDDEILQYHKSLSFRQIKTDYADISDLECPQVLESYQNFSTSNKKNYANLLNLIISTVDSYVVIIKLKYYNSIDYTRILNLSGNSYQSVCISSLVDFTTILLYNTKRNRFYYIYGKMVLSKTGIISGIDCMYSRQYISPGYIINLSKSSQLEPPDNSWDVVEKKTFKITKDTFLVNYTSLNT